MKNKLLSEYIRIGLLAFIALAINIYSSKATEIHCPSAASIQIKSGGGHYGHYEGTSIGGRGLIFTNNYNMYNEFPLQRLSGVSKVFYAFNAPKESLACDYVVNGIYTVTLYSDDAGAVKDCNPSQQYGGAFTCRH